jgi:hypothetical protein
MLALLLASAQEPDVIRFAVIGDNGTGERPQYEVGDQLAAARAAFPFEFVLMLGDNMYGRQEPHDFVTKFAKPYAALLAAGVPFYAALGNHDKQTNRFYQHFNMKGERYYTLTKKNVRFYVFDTNLMDDAQLAWIKQTLRDPFEGWKICIFHHPIYSDGGRHGSNLELRVVLEPLMVQSGVDVVFSGHEHLYERLVPQQGITYFVEGSSGQLRKGDLGRSPTLAAGFDEDQTFMLVELDAMELRFRTISRRGREVDAGVVRRRPQT